MSQFEREFVRRNPVRRSSARYRRYLWQLALFLPLGGLLVVVAMTRATGAGLSMQDAYAGVVGSLMLMLAGRAMGKLEHEEQRTE